MGSAIKESINWNRTYERDHNETEIGIKIIFYPEEARTLEHPGAPAEIEVFVDDVPDGIEIGEEEIKEIESGVMEFIADGGLER